jgi:AcrR family transcriptional regulator
MARPRSITDDEILDAAEGVFLEQGPQAPTAEVARRAGISEGTVFKRFGTKQDLFRAAMQRALTPRWTKLVEEFDVQGDVEAQLVELGLGLGAHTEAIIPKLVMMRGRGTKIGAVVSDTSDPPPVVQLRALNGLFARLQRAGRLGPGDPEIMARMFVGAIFHYSFAEYMGVDAWFPLPRPTFVRGVVHNLLNGIGHPPA